MQSFGITEEGIRERMEVEDPPTLKRHSQKKKEKGTTVQLHNPRSTENKLNLNQ